MSYVESKVLLKDEQIVKKVRLNSIVLVLAWIWGISGCWLLLIPTIKAISKTIRFKTTELVVTNKRVIEKYGWLNIYCDEMSLGKIENITTKQTFWGRIFNYGDICIQGTNRNNVIFGMVKNPEIIRKEINELS